MFASALFFATAGCEKKTDTEKAAEEIGEAVDAVKEAVENPE